MSLSPYLSRETFTGNGQPMAKERRMRLENMAAIQADEPAEDARDETLVEGEDIEEQILHAMNRSEKDVTYYVRVARVLGAAKLGAQEPHLFEGDATVVMPDLHTRLHDYGTGTYRVRILKNGVLWRRFDVAVENPVAKPTPPAPTNDLGTVLAAFQRSQERMMQMLEQRLQNPPAPAFDLFAGMERMTTIIKNMMPPPPPPPPAPADNAMAILNGFKEGIELAKSVAPGERETGVFDLVDSLLKSPILGQVFQAIASQSAQPAQPPAPQITRQPPAPAAPPPPPPEQQPATPAPSVGEILANLARNPTLQAQAKQACDYLVTLAQRDGDVEMYADWVLDNWDHRFVQMLLAQPSWFELICAISPEARGYQPWFTRLVAEIREIVNDAEATGASGNDARRNPPNGFDGNSRRESGDAGNAEMDGEPSEAGEG